MRPHDSAVRSDIGDGEDGHDAPHLPAPTSPDRLRQSLAHVQCAEQRLQIEEQCLDLDEDGDAGPGVVGKQIQAAALAPLVEARLRLEEELRSAEPAREQIDDRRVLLVGKANKLA